MLYFFRTMKNLPHAARHSLLSRGLIVLGISSIFLGAGCAKRSPYENLSPAEVRRTPEVDSVRVESPVPVATSTGTESVPAVKASYRAFTRAAYEADLAHGKPVLLFFYAAWCPYCQKQDPVLDAYYADAVDRGVDAFRVHYADSVTTAEEKKFATDFGIAQQHTFVLLGKNGKEITRHIGTLNAQQLSDFLAKAK